MTGSPIDLDYGLAMADGVGRGGLDDAELDAEAPRFLAARRAVAARVASGELGFWQLPADRGQLDAVRVVCAQLPAPTDVLVLGIGGSSLGARAIHQALSGPMELAGLSRSGKPRLHFPDNSDPWLLAALLSVLDPETTVALVISKSGGTVETAAQLLIVRDWLTRSLQAGDVRKRIVAITDQKAGSLRKEAEASGWPTLAVPSNVGGRFSLLSPVGLLPALLSGADVDALLSGAADMARRCETEALRDNPAGLLATLHVLHHRLRGRGIHVMLPYSDQLRPFAAWYVQLWAESLGKRRSKAGAIVETGPTPIAAVGATDQHAQVQLFIEGPRDKLITFVAVTESTADLAIPRLSGENAYLGGKTLAQLLDAEREGTTQALALDGRPSLTLTLRRLDAASLGALFFLYEAATAFAGELYDVEAFDQPGVELGKRLAFGLLGREGYQAQAEQIRARAAQHNPRHTCR